MKLNLALKALKDSRNVFRQARLAVVSHLKAAEASCPICGFHGKFRGFGDPVRTAAQCPQCWSLERHRLFALAVQRNAISFAGRDVLNFTPDFAVGSLAKGNNRYHTSNYPSANGADFAFDIQAIDLPDASYDIVICSHILEHVDDRRAFAEIHRILRRGGQLLFMIPIIEGWATTYENPDILSEADRHVHFGQFDHIRYYGADVRDRATQAGFLVSEYCGSPIDCVKHGLIRGEKVFIATKP
jgi:SAM-dependent methyltransferase